MRAIIELAHNVIAGQHHLIQLLRDIDSRPERGIVFIWPPAEHSRSRTAVEGAVFTLTRASTSIGEHGR